MDPDRRQCLVLLVEDDGVPYELYSEILASAGFAVIGADNGEDALRQALQQRPDLIVMDYELRGMDGVTATNLLRSDPRTADIPIVMLTGHVARRQLERARQAKCDAFLTKPCSIERLLDQVKQLLDPEIEHARNRSNAILVVEDDDDIRASIMTLLHDEGFEVAGASNGRGALEYLRHASEPPQLILLDLMMPVMDGWTFRTEQLADAALAHIPVVILSATTDVAQSARRLAVEEFLPKPLDPRRLLDVVGRHA